VGDAWVRAQRGPYRRRVEQVGRDVARRPVRRVRGPEMSGQTPPMAKPLDDGSWEIQDRRVTFPVRITSAAAAAAVYLVRSDRASRLLAGTGLELVSFAGRTPLALAFVDYHAGDLGSYHEVGVALLVRHRGHTGPYIHQLPVTQPFTLEAGRALWGLPKWLARAELSLSGADATCHLADDDGRHVLTAALRTLPWRLPLNVPGALTALAPRDDTVLATRVRGRVSGIRIGPGGARVVLGGEHPMADELRAIGLPRRPVVTMIAEQVVFELDSARSLPR
jgi:hypothetical protein